MTFYVSDWSEVTAVLLPDGWHIVTPGAVGINKAECSHTGDGFYFWEGAALFQGPLSSVLAVKSALTVGVSDTQENQ